MAATRTTPVVRPVWRAMSARAAATSASTFSAWTSRSSPAGGQLDALRRAPQQRQPELGLEPADLLRERRLGDVERLGRAREVLVARDRGEVLELPQLQGVGPHPQVRDRAAGLEHELAGLGLPAAVPVLERARRERDVDHDLLAGVGLDHGEADEPALRALDRAVRARRVDLDDLAAAARAGVDQPHGRAVHRQVVPGRVAEAVAERQQRLDRRRGSRSPGPRRRAGRRRPGVTDGRPSSDAGQVIGRRPPGSAAPKSTSASALPASWPGNQHSSTPGHLVQPRQQHRRARVDHDDRARLRLVDASHELVLAAGQRERVAVEALALDLRRRADDHDRDVGLARERRRRARTRPPRRTAPRG